MRYELKITSSDEDEYDPDTGESPYEQLMNRVSGDRWREALNDYLSKEVRPYLNSDMDGVSDEAYEKLCDVFDRLHTYIDERGLRLG